MIATDTNNCITLLNPVAERLTGWQFSDAFGKNSTEVFQITHEESRTPIESPISQALNLGEVVHLPEQTILIAKNGAEVPIDDSAAPIKDEQVAIAGAVLIFRDIINRKRAEQRLAAHHTVTRILAESATLTEAIPQLLQTICIGLEWDLGEFWSVEQPTNMLRYIENWHLSSVEGGAEFGASTQQLTYPPCVGLPGCTWDRGELVWITDVTNEANFLRNAIAAQVGLHTAISIPLLSGLEILGVMTFFSQKIRQPDEDLLKMMATIGSQIGQFIERKQGEIALRESEQRLAWQSRHDALTGLLNRRAFEQDLDVALSSAKKENQEHTLCYLDLDQFKIVNDTCGHGAGDELLCQATALVRSQVRTTDILARLGGDEFALLLKGCPPQQALPIANALRQKLQEFRFVWQDKTFTIGVSIGIVGIDANTVDLTSALRSADIACYGAKNAGRNRVHVYQADEGEVSRHGQMQWISRLSKALEENRFCLYFQPIVPLVQAQFKPVYYEVLLRLKDENDKVIPPMAFIPAAERYNLMPLIDRWVVRTFFASLGQHYRDTGKHCSREDNQCMYAINLSGASINDDQFIDFLHEQFALHQIPPQAICFEITETVAITNLSKAGKLIRELKQLGCCFALDDFGNGVSSFAYLKNLSVDYLKIDGEFVRDIVDDPTDLALTEAINQVGHAMGIQTIAEFVENDAILEKIAALGVDYAQGYGIAKPRPLELRV